MQIRNILSGTSCLALLAAGGIGYAGSLSSADRNFMITPAQTDMTEAHIGQMAENQAARTDVKDFAKTLVQEHTESYENLTRLAAKTGVSIPKGINAAKHPAIRQLVRLKGTRFDRDFARDEIAADRQEIAVFKREAARGHDADAKSFAVKTIPILEKDLQLAEQCAKPARHG